MTFRSCTLISLFESDANFVHRSPMTLEFFNKSKSFFTAWFSAKEVLCVPKHVFPMHRPLVSRNRWDLAVRTCALLGLRMSTGIAFHHKEWEYAFYGLQFDCCIEEQIFDPKQARPVQAESTAVRALRRIMLLGEETRGVTCV